MVPFSYIKTPLGWVKIQESNSKLTSLQFVEGPMIPEDQPLTPLSQKVKTDLKLYFESGILNPSFPLEPEGTPFQKQLWDLLLQIPKGKTISYKQLAQLFGNPKAIRSVANAVAKNPILLYIPCHRVIGSDGSMTGYAAGIQKKIGLLEREGVSIQKRLNL